MYLGKIVKYQWNLKSEVSPDDTCFYSLYPIDIFSDSINSLTRSTYM